MGSVLSQAVYEGQGGRNQAIFAEFPFPAAPASSCPCEIPLDQVRAAFSSNPGNEIVVLENMENEAAA
jgi:hypothetical protein